MLKVRALNAALELSSLTPSLLLLSASSAQLDKFLGAAQLVVSLAPMDSLRPALDLLSVLISLAMLASLLMEVGALLAALELSSLTASLLLLRASSAQLARLLGKLRLGVTLAHLEKQQVALDLQSALISLAMRMSLLMETSALLVRQAPPLRGALQPNATL